MRFLKFLIFFGRQGCKIPRQPDIESLMNCPGIYRTRNLLHSTISDCYIPLREFLWTNHYSWMGSSWYFFVVWVTLKRASVVIVSMFDLTLEKSWCLRIYQWNCWNHLCYKYIYTYIYIYTYMYTHIVIVCGQARCRWKKDPNFLRKACGGVLKTVSVSP